MRTPLLYVGILSASSLLGQVDFATSIHPVLAQRCAPCHAGDKAAAGLSVESREAILKVVVPGKPDESLLMKRVTGSEGARMPPVGGNLSDVQIATLRSWIAEGAAWTDTRTKTSTGWVPPIAPRTPDIPLSSMVHPLDKFIGAYFTKQEHEFPAPVGDALFLRRATLDIWGFVPTAERTQSFVADTDPLKREHLIEALLADSSRYAENWISFWNDLLRNDQGVNYAGTRKSITPWLLTALQTNMPYDAMARALLNPEKPSDPDGFLVGVNWRGDINASQTPYMQAAQNSAQIFLGVNLKCASCHDSFINRYKLKQSYSLAAMFSETPDLELVRCDAKTGKFTGPEFLFPEIGEKPGSDSLKDRRQAAARSFTSEQDGRFSRTVVNRYWQRLFGRGLVANVDEMDAEPWNADLLDWLASDFTRHGYDLKYLLKRIMTSRAYALPTVPEKDVPSSEYKFAGPKLRRLTAEQFADSLSEITGEWRVSQAGDQAHYAREWELKSTPMTRAMGRPIRDQVFTTREDAATTLQALELVNGETLAAELREAALRLRGELPEAPKNLFDSKRVTKDSVNFEIDLDGARELWLLTADAGSYDPSRTVAGWMNLEVVGPEGAVRVSDLATFAKFTKGPLKSSGAKDDQGLIQPVGSLAMFPIADLGFTRLRGSVGVDDGARSSDISPSVRFFVFTGKPDMERLLRVTGEPPVAFPAVSRDQNVLVNRLFWEALSRAPNEKELAAAKKLRLEDLIWSLLMHPEFQYVR